MTSRRPYHRGLSDPITDLDHFFWRLRGTIWARRSVCVSERAGSTFLHVFGVGDTVSVLITLGRRIETSCTRRMVASHAVPTYERTTLIALSDFTRCTVIFDLSLVSFRTQKSLAMTCRKLSPSELGIDHMAGGLCCLFWQMPIHSDVLASAAQCPKHR